MVITGCCREDVLHQICFLSTTRPIIAILRHCCPQQAEPTRVRCGGCSQLVLWLKAFRKGQQARLMQGFAFHFRWDFLFSFPPFSSFRELGSRKLKSCLSFYEMEKFSSYSPVIFLLQNTPVPILLPLLRLRRGCLGTARTLSRSIRSNRICFALPLKIHCQYVSPSFT